MLRRAVCAVAVLAFAFSVATADTFFGSIRKVEDGKITVGTKYDKETKKFAEEKTFTVAKDVKVMTGGKFNKEDKTIAGGQELKGGLQSKRLQNIGDRGVRAVITTNGAGEVTEIHVMGGRKKKNQ